VTPGPGAPEPGDWAVVGSPVPGTEAAVAAVERGAGQGLATADPNFDPAAFAAWSVTVFDRALKAWQTGDPEPLHPVMQDHVWERYAQWLLFVRAVPIMRTIMGDAHATPAFVGATADGGHHSALVEFTVQPGRTVLTPGVSQGVMHKMIGHFVDMPGDNMWLERWLFQRPAGSRTNPSGAVDVCPVCGAPAQPEETGQCRYCHADITTRTAGWLVTRTATTMRGAKSMGEGTGQGAAGGALAQPPRISPGAPLRPPRISPGAPLQPPRISPGAPLQPPRGGPA